MDRLERIAKRVCGAARGRNAALSYEIDGGVTLTSNGFFMKLVPSGWSKVGEFELSKQDLVDASKKMVETLKKHSEKVRAKGLDPEKLDEKEVQVRFNDGKMYLFVPSQSLEFEEEDDKKDDKKDDKSTKNIESIIEKMKQKVLDKFYDIFNDHILWSVDLKDGTSLISYMAEPTLMNEEYHDVVDVIIDDDTKCKCKCFVSLLNKNDSTTFLLSVGIDEYNEGRPALRSFNIKDNDLKGLDNGELSKMFMKMRQAVKNQVDMMFKTEGEEMVNAIFNNAK